MILNKERLQAWSDTGFLHLPGFFGDGKDLSEWTNELVSWPETAGKWMKYFEASVDGTNPRMLCRVENFLEYHPEWERLIHDSRMQGVLEQLFGEPACLFKEKINLKLPGGNGFSAHQDAPAFAVFGQEFHITAMVSIDASTRENGCLEMASGHHHSGLLEMTESQVLSDRAVAELDWTEIETQPGDLVLFGSMIPHRSGVNASKKPRRAAYITYNRQSEGSHRAAYYQSKRATFPPEIERIPGQDYSNSGMYNIGNPIRE